MFDFHIELKLDDCYALDNYQNVQYSQSTKYHIGSLQQLY